MDAPFLLDAYTRTPSPNDSASASPASLPQTPSIYQLELAPAPAKPAFDHYLMHDDHQHGIPPEGLPHWQANQMHYSQQAPQQQGSLLGELYEHELPHEQPQMDLNYGHDWHQQQQLPRIQPMQQQDASLARRATFPHQTYGGPFEYPGASAGPHYREYDHRVKLEDPSSSMVVPSHAQMMYRSPSLGDIAPHSLPPYLQAHPAIPVQHTDDAASKETQYLRRRCFNCSQTEPPSWRRSTLNPGKIVCNKCGLYERTHLRPRPLRFDELRTGNKGRKKSGKGTPAAPNAETASAPVPIAPVNIKQEPLEAPPMSRRTSVSSNHSSDWDDSASIASSGSRPPSSYGSPAAGTLLPLSEHSPTPIPRQDNGIRLPAVDMGLGALSMGSPASRPGSSAGAVEFGLGQDQYFMRSAPQDVPLPASVPSTPGFVGSPGSIGAGSPALLARDLSDAANWGSPDATSPPSRGVPQRRPSILRSTVVAQ
ncbi:unnamed protein product [Peniophora sp. CBMAI 1063]|nr:unnamed protein product [Peniophora sp. CBMAI 1063]